MNQFNSFYTFNNGQYNDYTPYQTGGGYTYNAFGTSSPSFWGNQAFQQKPPTQNNSFMQQMMAFATMSGDSSMIKEFMPFLMMQKIQSGGSFMDMMPLLQMMNQPEPPKPIGINGSEGSYDETTTEGFAKNALESYQDYKLSDEYLLGKAAPKTVIEFTADTDFSKEEYTDAVMGLAEQELEGCDLDDDGEITTDEYAEAKYNQIMDRYDELYEEGDISERNYDAIANNLEAGLKNMAKTMDFSYNEDGEAKKRKDGILQKRDVAAYFAHTDWKAGGKHDGAFMANDEYVMRSAAMKGNSSLRSGLFDQQKGLFEE